MQKYVLFKLVLFICCVISNETHDDLNLIKEVLTTVPESEDSQKKKEKIQTNTMGKQHQDR